MVLRAGGRARIEVKSGVIEMFREAHKDIATHWCSSMNNKQYVASMRIRDVTIVTSNHVLSVNENI